VEVAVPAVLAVAAVWAVAQLPAEQVRLAVAAVVTAIALLAMQPSGETRLRPVPVGW